MAQLEVPVERAPLMDTPAERRTRSGPLRSWILTSVGKKAVMAATGGILVLFVVVHLLGNLQLFQGEEALNRYARFLRIEPALLWTARLVLLAAAVTHVVFGTMLFVENRRARPVSYSRQEPVQASIASRTMIYSGLIVMGFIAYHLMHLTFGSAEPSGYVFQRHNVYRNVIAGFRNPYITSVYILGQILLYFHLSHGVQSMFQSLGLSHERYRRTLASGGMALAFVVAAGNMAMPLAVLLGLLR
jgi:succinate dehydrogenase / fumarate reductase, cytochrome b subunit